MSFSGLGSKSSSPIAPVAEVAFSEPLARSHDLVRSPLNSGKTAHIIGGRRWGHKLTLRTARLLARRSRQSNVARRDGMWSRRDSRSEPFRSHAGGRSGFMERQRLQSMSVEQLWQLHTMINDILAGRLIAKKQELQRRLKLLNPE